MVQAALLQVLAFATPVAAQYTPALIIALLRTSVHALHDVAVGAAVMGIAGGLGGERQQESPARPLPPTKHENWHRFCAVQLALLQVLAFATPVAVQYTPLLTIAALRSSVQDVHDGLAGGATGGDGWAAAGPPSSAEPLLLAGAPLLVELSGGDPLDVAEPLVVAVPLPLAGAPLLVVELSAGAPLLVAEPLVVAEPLPLAGAPLLVAEPLVVAEPLLVVAPLLGAAPLLVASPLLVADAPLEGALP